MSTILFIAVPVIILISYLSQQSFNHKSAKLYNEYMNALSEQDKQKALEAGRKYYRHMRFGRLTVYDEQAISNDLSVM